MSRRDQTSASMHLESTWSARERRQERHELAEATENERCRSHALSGGSYSTSDSGEEYAIAHEERRTSRGSLRVPREEKEPSELSSPRSPNTHRLPRPSQLNLLSTHTHTHDRTRLHLVRHKSNHQIVLPPLACIRTISSRVVAPPIPRLLDSSTLHFSQASPRSILGHGETDSRAQRAADCVRVGGVGRRPGGQPARSVSRVTRAHEGEGQVSRVSRFLGGGCFEGFTSGGMGSWSVRRVIEDEERTGGRKGGREGGRKGASSRRRPFLLAGP